MKNRQWVRHKLQSLETPKIQLTISKEKMIISDRMPFHILDVILFVLSISIVAVFILGIVGIVYALVFSIGYLLFRYTAYIIWKTIEIDLVKNQLIITNRVFNKKNKTQLISSSFKRDNLILKEIEQSGMQRAMLQYKSHKIIDLVLLTHSKDIELVKRRLFNKN